MRKADQLMIEFEIDMPNKPIDSEIFGNENKGFSLYVRDGSLFIFGHCTQAEAQAMIDAHNPPETTEPTVEEKLASVGLTITDLKTALGL